jgi:hypothetical protein
MTDTFQAASLMFGPEKLDELLKTLIHTATGRPCEMCGHKFGDRIPVAFSSPTAENTTTTARQPPIKRKKTLETKTTDQTHPKKAENDDLFS